MAEVEVRDLTVRYGKLTAVEDLSFTIPPGEVFGFIGPNGAGKSSTIRVMATLQQPAGGSVRIDGLDVAVRPREVRRLIGYMPDQFGVYEDLTAEEYLHFFAAAYRLPRGQRTRRVGDVLELTDLAGKRDAAVESLSRGMRQRLGVARVLLHDPEVLLLDEPASGLDPRARIEIREILKELKGMGKTVLVSSHILHELAQLCTRIGILEAGRLVAEGPLDSIYRQLDLLRIVHVGVTNPDPARIEAIRALPGVATVTRQADRLVVELREGETPPEDLLDGIRATGARIRMFQPEAMDMETVFMKLTEGTTA